MTSLSKAVMECLFSLSRRFYWVRAKMRRKIGQKWASRMPLNARFKGKGYLTLNRLECASRRLSLTLLCLFLSGCTLLGLGHPSNPMTAEQIAAYEKMGKDVWGCFSVTGPPPTGGITWLVTPKGAKPNLAFGANCQLIRANAGG